MRICGVFTCRKTAGDAEGTLMTQLGASGRLCNILPGGSGGHTELAKALWKDPDYVAKQRAGFIAALSKQSAALKAAFARPEVRARLVELQNRPEIQAARRIRVSAQAKRQWADPAFRAMRSVSSRSQPKKAGTTSKHKNVAYHAGRRSWRVYYNDGGTRILDRWFRTEEAALAFITAFLATRRNVA